MTVYRKEDTLNNTKRCVQFVALGPSCADLTWDIPEGVERWGIQYTWQTFKCNRYFVMDDEDWIVAKNHSFANPIDIEGEIRKTNVPVYVSKKWKNVANTVEYPIGPVLEYFKPIQYFMNSMAYMFALAIWEGFERIECYGIDLRYFTELGDKMEYKYNWIDETNCLAFWAGLAIGRGIEVVTTKRSSLMKPVYPGDPSLYGYETSPEIKKQREGILSSRKKINLKQEPEKLMLFRPNKGEDQQDFLRRIETGNAKPFKYVEAKSWYDIKESASMEAKDAGVGATTITVGDGSRS